MPTEKSGTYHHVLTFDRLVGNFPEDSRKRARRQGRSAIPASAYESFAVGSPRSDLNRAPLLGSPPGQDLLVPEPYPPEPARVTTIWRCTIGGNR